MLHPQQQILSASTTFSRTHSEKLGRNVWI